MKKKLHLINLALYLSIFTIAYITFGLQPSLNLRCRVPQRGQQTRKIGDFEFSACITVVIVARRTKSPACAKLWYYTGRTILRQR